MEQLPGYQRSALFAWGMTGTAVLVCLSVWSFGYGMSILDGAGYRQPATPMGWVYIAAGITGALFWSPLLALLTYIQEEIRSHRKLYQHVHQLYVPGEMPSKPKPKMSPGTQEHTEPGGSADQP